MAAQANNIESMIAIFDEDGGGDVDFEEFVSGLSAFSAKGNKEQKLQFAFKVYDIDRDGYISNGELFIVLKMMVGSNLKDQQLQQIVDKTIMEADLDGDGKISFEEFTKMVESTDVSMSMTLGLSAARPHPGLNNMLTVHAHRPVLVYFRRARFGGPKWGLFIHGTMPSLHDNDNSIQNFHFPVPLPCEKAFDDIGIGVLSSISTLTFASPKYSESYLASLLWLWPRRRS